MPTFYHWYEAVVYFGVMALVWGFAILAVLGNLLVTYTVWRYWFGDLPVTVQDQPKPRRRRRWRRRSR